jgi:hypothetical protein
MQAVTEPKEGNCSLIDREITNTTFHIRQVFAVTCSKLLLPLLQLRKTASDAQSSPLLSAAENIIVTSFFHPVHLPEYAFLLFAFCVPGASSRADCTAIIRLSRRTRISKKVQQKCTCALSMFRISLSCAPAQRMVDRKLPQWSATRSSCSIRFERRCRKKVS